jgi:hypothetical protein
MNSPGDIGPSARRRQRSSASTPAMAWASKSKIGW